MTRLTKLVLSSILIGGLAACAAASSDEVTLDAAMTSDVAASKHKHMGHAATVKPGADVSLNSVLPKAMSPGSYQTVQLRFEEGYTSGPMSVTIEPSAGLSLFGGTDSMTFDMSGPGEHIWDLDVKADTDGVYFLNVFADAQGQQRSFSVRLNMGQVTQKMFDEAMPADGELIDGGKIRVLDADETIK